MKRFLKIFAGIVIFFALVHLTARLTGNGYLAKGLWACYLHGNNSATIDDAKYFNTHEIKAGKGAEWPLHAGYNKAPLPPKLQDVLTKTQSVAFLIVQNDRILSEHYWDNYNDSSLSNSFSMAKSITTMLAQIAIQKGFLKSWHQKVNTLLPGLKGPYAAELELWHLSAMCSGLDWDEAYKNPFSITAKSYYGDDERKLMLSLPIVDEPGKKNNYQSGSTQLLAMCIMQATGKSLADLASDWLWKPIQAEHDARWHTDAQGAELAYCCFNSDARDFARFGKLMLHDGNWNGTQILDSSFVKMATSPVLVPFYGYSFWLSNQHGTKVFMQQGLLGQYIITIPEYRLVIVRLGKYNLPEKGDMPEDFDIIVDEVLGIVRSRQPD